MEQATPPHLGPPGAERALRESAKEVTGLWWPWLLAGIAWGVIALVILQFDAASISTVGVLVGGMFMFAAIQNFALASVPGAVRWVSALFGVLFLVAAVICFVSPENTFAALADSLGFLFLFVGVVVDRPGLPGAGGQPALVARVDLRDPDDDPGVLDRRSVLHREGLRPARVRRHLGADGVDKRHRARLRHAPRASGAVEATH